jgi:hypothetical protein
MAKTSTVAKERPTRTPVSGPRDVLTVADKDPNYVYRWVNDTVGRIDRYLAGGYEFVQQAGEIGQKTVDRASRLGSVVTRSVGGTVTGVLMRIPREWYDEDQEAKQDQIDSLEDSMRQEAMQDRYGSLTIETGK